jgi:hypothetical protein
MEELNQALALIERASHEIQVLYGLAMALPPLQCHWLSFIFHLSYAARQSISGGAEGAAELSGKIQSFRALQVHPRFVIVPLPPHH